MAGGRAGSPRTVLEELLRHQDRTYEEVAEEFQRIAHQLGERGLSISARHLRRLASGERSGTTPATRRVLQVLFNRGVDELLQPFPGSQASSITPPGQVVASFAGTSEEIIAAAAQRARGFALLTHASTTTELMDQIYDDVRELALIYSHRPLPELLGRLAATQDVLFALLEARQSPACARRLYFLASVMSTLLARASHDLGDVFAALAQAHTGFICADRADHDGLRAMIRGFQSTYTYWANQPHESIRYAQSGMRFAAAAGSSTAVWLPTAEARAWARLGHDVMACELIEQAERKRDQVRPDDLDELGGVCTFGRSRQLYVTADTLAWLPNRAKLCRRYCEQAVAAYQDTSAQDWSFMFQACSHTDLAMARIGEGELDGTAEAMAPVFELDPAQRTNSIMRSVQRVQSALSNSPHAGSSPELEAKMRAFAGALTVGQKVRALPGPARWT
jgi:hypothetical protein